MKSSRWLSVGLILLWIWAYASGQSGGAGIGTSSGAETVTGTGTTTIASKPGFNGVKSTPFSADVVEETNQTLVDGNRIHRETHGRMLRDSEGRTRNESEFPFQGDTGEKRTYVRITDPVQQIFISLDGQRKTAVVEHLKPTPTQGAPDGSASAPLSNSSSSRSRANIREENLGTTEIEGFVVTGKRVIHTTEAGEIGNEKPIVSVTEIWYSHDLHLPLLTKSESPQTGEHVRKLINIETGEPDSLLFQIPQDYAVKETTH